jgi:hypothetical protein
VRYFRSIKFPIEVLLLVTVCLLFYPILTASSQTSTIVVVAPSTVSAHVGEPFNVTVSLSNVQNLYGLEVILNWDPDVLRVSKVDVRLGVETYPDGVLHESSSSPPIFIAENNLTQSEGEYSLVATSMAPASSFSGSGNIVRLTFEPLAVGTSKIDLESQLLDYPPTDRDPRISQPIAHSSQGSSITVEKSTSGSQQTDSTPPEIKVVSPVNQTYDEVNIPLVFNVNEPLNWIGYSLDGKENVTIMGNVTLNNLSNGLHNVTIYANDTSGNMGVSETLNFVVVIPELEPEPFPVVPIAAASAIVAVAAGAGLLIYFRKHKHECVYEYEREFKKTFGYVCS